MRSASKAISLKQVFIFLKFLQSGPFYYWKNFFCDDLKRVGFLLNFFKSSKKCSTIRSQFIMPLSKPISNILLFKEETVVFGWIEWWLLVGGLERRSQQNRFEFAPFNKTNSDGEGLAGIKQARLGRKRK
jgi:hypothetical protein